MSYGRMAKGNVVCIYNGILLSQKKKKRKGKENPAI